MLKIQKVIKTNRAGELGVTNKAGKVSNLNDLIKSILTGDKVNRTPDEYNFVNAIQFMDFPEKMFSKPHILHCFNPDSPSTSPFTVGPTLYSDLYIRSVSPLASTPSVNVTRRSTYNSTSTKSKSQ